MRITVLGASRFAIATIRRLIENKHEVVLIDHDSARLDEVADELDCGMIHGDGTLPSTLREAFGDRSDAFVALTNEDHVNLLASVVARSVGYPRVVPQVSRTELLPIIDELGLGETISPHDSVARSLVAALEQRDQLSTVGVLQNELRLVLVQVPEGFGPQTFAAIALPESAKGIARIRNGSETELGPDSGIAPEDRLLIVVGSADHDAIIDLFADQDR